MRQRQRPVPAERAAAGRAASSSPAPTSIPRPPSRLAAEHGLAACTPEELLARDDVDVVLCLTPPDTHAGVALDAIAAGKHVYTEKPLATSLARAREVLEAAAAAGVRVGCAPDTFLGAGIQTLKAAVDGGAIGTPALAQVRMLGRPPEAWHPSPAFLYADLAGPLLDLGPYGITTAVELVGRVRRVTRARHAAARQRPDRHRAARGHRVPDRRADARRRGARARRRRADHVRDDVRPRRLGAPRDRGLRRRRHAAGRRSEHVRRAGGPAPPRAGDEPLELVSEWRDNARGLGLQDLCRAVRDGTPQRASGALGLHVLEVLLAIRDSARDGAAIAIG